MGLGRYLTKFFYRYYNRRRHGQIFTDFICSDENLSDQSVKENLEKALVEIIYADEGHLGCGLLVSTDGYFLTCRHCLNVQDGQAIKTSDGKKYKIEKTCVISKKYDLALAKAEIPVKAEAQRFKYGMFSKKSSKMTALLIRRNGDLEVKGGLANNFFGERIVGERYYAEVMSVNTPCKNGDSGGVVVSLPDYRLIGITAFNRATEEYYGGYFQWYHALELLTHFKRRF